MESKAPLTIKGELHIPCIFAAPEILFHDRITPAVDIWALNVFMHVFASLVGPREIVRERVLRQIVTKLGKLPDRYWSMWDTRSEWFDDDGKGISKEDVYYSLLNMTTDRLN